MNSRSTYLTSPHALAVVLAVACASGAMATARTTPSQASDEDVIPWLPRRPHVEAPPPMAPPCRGADLRGTLTLQGGVGKLVGGAQLRNVGSRPCSLRGRPRLRFAGGSSTPTSWRVVAVRADPRDASLVYDRGSSLRALAPGRAAALPLLWSNWCPPGTVVTTTGPPPARLVLALPRGGEIELAVRQAPRCDDPDSRSTLAVKPFAPIGRQPSPRSRVPLEAAILGNVDEAKPGLATLQVRRGTVLHYRVVLMNASRRPFHFAGCPTYEQHVAPRGAPERYVLNCRPVGLLAPGRRVTFAMRLRVPRSTSVGPNGLFWVLAPATYVPPTASARLVVAR